MANLIDYHYFRDQFEIASLNRDIQNNLAYRQDIDRYITTYETECLKLFLGYDINDSQCLYTLFIAGLEAGSGSEYTRMTALKDRLIDSAKFISPIAGYVYFKWLEFHRGKVIDTSENQLKYIPADAALMDDSRILRIAQNYMIGLFEQVHDWLKSEAQAATYPEYTRSLNYFKSFDFNKIFSFQNSFDI